MLSIDVLAPTVRTIPRAVVAVAAAVLVPTAVTAVRGGHDLSGALLVASLVAGAGVGYAVDDRAARTFASSPTPLIVRRAMRATLIVAVLGAAWLTAFALALAGADTDAPTLISMSPYAAASATIAWAFATRVEPDAPLSPGLIGALASLLTMLLIDSMSMRFEHVPSLQGHDGAAWWWIALGGLALALQASRDPAAPAFTRRRK